MKLHLGPPPDSRDFAPDENWHPLREPSMALMQLYAAPLGIITTAFIGFLWSALTPLRTDVLTMTEEIFQAGWAVLLAFAGLVVVHELLHAVVHPRAGRSPNSILGGWPSRGLFYAHYDGELSRNRFVAILLAPLLVISVLPLLVAAAAQIPSGWAAGISVCNAFLASGDIFGTGLVLWQIPATAIVRNQGWRTYWKPHTT